jgi:acetyl-CoA carboxylase biotin carboxyl carrier protein
MTRNQRRREATPLAKKNSGKKGSKDNGAVNVPLGRQSPMDLDLLERITRLMRDNDLNTVEVRDGDKRVILKRGAVTLPAVSGNAGYVPQPVSFNAGPASGATNASATASSGNAAAITDTEQGLVAIKSPMVGTFYSASSPDAKAFVSVGSTVDEETDVCIIEAMKVFNNIKAEMKGTIAKIVVTNGQTVEFGQPLFLVKPS